MGLWWQGGDSGGCVRNDCWRRSRARQSWCVRGRRRGGHGLGVRAGYLLNRLFRGGRGQYSVDLRPEQ